MSTPSPIKQPLILKAFPGSENFEKSIEKCAEILKDNGLVAFPTETVFGLGANALSDLAVNKIFLTKGRPADNPLIVHVGDVQQVEDLLQGPLPQVARRMAERFWPGPLTIIFPLSPHAGISSLVTCGLDSVGLRIPSDPVALALLRACALPVAAPSANRSGRPSPVSASHVVEDLGEKGGVTILDDGREGCEVGVESTVVKLRFTGEQVEEVAILRPGGVSQQELEEVCAPFDIPVTVPNSKKSALSEPASPEAPGMKYRHYAPRGEVQLVEDKAEIKRMVEEARSERGRRRSRSRSPKRVSGEAGSSDLPQRGKKVFLLFEDLFDYFLPRQATTTACPSPLSPLPPSLLLGSLGKREKVSDACQSLFKLLRACDSEKVEHIFVDSDFLKSEGLGPALWNRLSKAAVGKNDRQPDSARG